MRLIDADALSEHKFVSIDCYLKSNVDNGFSQYKQGWNGAIDAIIDNAPTVLHDNYSMGYQDGVRKVLSDRPQGEWITWEEAGNYIASPNRHECSCCHDSAQVLVNGIELLSDFCPNCGADMRKEADND